MISCVFDRATGRFIGGQRHSKHSHDPVTQVEIQLEDYPDADAERWDGANGVRPATQDEIDACDDEQEEARAEQEIDNSRAIKAVVMWAAKQFGIKPKDARAAIKDEYRALK